MTDIKYKWKSDSAVGLDPNLILPQFKVVGHHQSEKVITLSTGEFELFVHSLWSRAITSNGRGGGKITRGT